MANTPIYSAEAVVKVDLASNVTVTTAANLDTFFSTGTAIESLMKDVTIVEPKGDTGKVDLIGQDTNGYQHAVKDRKPASMAEVSGTLILPADGTGLSFFYDDSVSVTGGATRYRSGKVDVKEVSFLLQLTSGTDEINFVLHDCDITSKDTKVSGADTHFEVTFTAKCLPSNYYGPEIVDNS